MDGHGPIELPQEAAPLTRDNLIATLQNAVSNQQQRIRVGTAQLQAWETKEGYFKSLQDLFMQRDYPLDVRMLCLIQLKNGIDKYWRKMSTHPIKQEEKEVIRSRLFQSSVAEQNSNLVSLNATVTARIARYDFPDRWPDLAQELVTLLKSAAQVSGSSSALSSALITAHHVVKELATVRMARSRASFYNVAPDLFKVVEAFYSAGMPPIISNYIEGSGQLNSEVLQQISLMEKVLKILRRLVVAGYDIPHHDAGVRAFWTSSEVFLQKFMNSLSHPDQTKATSVYPLAKQIAKMHHNMAVEHTVSFPLLPQTAELVRLYWRSAVELRNRQIRSPEDIEDADSMYDWLNLKTLLLLRACLRLSTSSLRPVKFKKSKNEENENAVDEPAQARHRIKTELLVENFLIDVFRVLISTFFIYMERDLDEWTSEPEEWDMKETGDDSAYEQSVRACAERLFLDITIHYRDLVTQPLLESLETLSSTHNDDPIMKDAMFSAIGISASILHGKLNFVTIINQQLVPELEKGASDRTAQILRRRTAILLAHWIGVDIPQENRPLVYQIYEHLLDPAIGANSQIVRITAAKRLADVVNDWDFNANKFEPCAAKILHRLIGLIRECALVETKMSILNTTRVIVERLGSDVKPFAETIVEVLPPLWEESGNQHLMKQSIVQVLINLVNALMEGSTPLQPFVVPIVKAALEPGSSTQLYLLGDALDLLQAVVRQTPRPVSPDLIALVPILLNVFELEMEYLEKGVAIAESYVLAGPAQMLHDDIRPLLFQGLRSLMNVKRPRIIDEVARIVEQLIRAATDIGGEAALEYLASSLSQIGVLTRMFDSIYEFWEANQTTGPNSKERPADWKNEANYFAVFSRIIWASPKVFFSAISDWAQQRQLGNQVALDRLLEEWFRSMDSVVDPTKSKLLTLALTKFLESGQPWILAKLQDLMTLWTSLVTELRDEDTPTRDTLVYDPPPEGTDFSGSCEDKRRAALTYSDPVHTVSLMEFIKYALNEAIKASGGSAQEFQDAWMVNVDKEVVKTFSELGIM